MASARALPIALAILVGACGGGGDDSGGDGGGAGEDASASEACSTLSLRDCRLRDDCLVWECVSPCDCTVDFGGCVPMDDMDYGCPDAGCLDDVLLECCGATDTCEDGTTCAPPGTPDGCGICLDAESDCADDAGCADGSICEPVHCACDATLQCAPGCTDDSCAAGEVCTGGDHPRCAAATCDDATPCPDDFDCDDGTCTRRPCEADEVCDGYCVLGLCHAQLGECRVPAE